MGQERAREARERTLASKKHALDLALRACVGEVASACAESLKKKDRATLGKALAAARKDVLAVSEQAKALDAPRCLELFAAYALGRVALGEGSLPEDDARSVREARAPPSRSKFRGDLNLHEPPPCTPRKQLLPAATAECAPPLIFERFWRIVIWARKAVDKTRGAILEMEAEAADAPRTGRRPARPRPRRRSAHAEVKTLLFDAKGDAATGVASRAGGAARTRAEIGARPRFADPVLPRHGGTRRVGTRSPPARGVAIRKAKRAISASPASCRHTRISSLTVDAAAHARCRSCLETCIKLPAAQPLHRA